MKKMICILLLLCPLFAGCNGAVFVDDFLPEPPVVALSGTERSVKVDFDSGNWGVWGINGWEGLAGVVCGLDGKPDGRELPLEDGELAVISYGNDYFDCRVEKRSGKELLVVYGENLNEEEVRIEVIVGNRYEMKTIPVSLAPTGKYKIDGIVYHWDGMVVSDNELKTDRSFVVDNGASDQPVSWHFDPDGAFPDREITFWGKDGFWNPLFYERLFGDPLPRIVIPDIVEGRPVLRDTEVEFGLERQRIASEPYGGEQVVTVPGGERWRIEVNYLMEKYWIDYTMEAVDPATGKKRVFSGTLSSARPYDYFITKRKEDVPKD